MRSLAVVALCLLVALPPALAKDRHVPTDKAKKLNNDGMAAYKAKDYEKAIALFGESIEADSEWELNHFNLACCIALKIAAESWCPQDIEEIVAHLQKTLAINPERRAKLLSDPDLTSFRRLAAYTVLVGGDLRSALVSASPWVSDTPGPGVWPTRLAFTATGFTETPPGDPDQPNVVPKKAKGTYEVKAGSITLIYSGGRRVSAKVDASGVLVVTDAGDTFYYGKGTSTCGV